MLKKSWTGIILLLISVLLLSGCSMSVRQEDLDNIKNASIVDTGVSKTDNAIVLLKNEDTTTDFDNSYEYYLTEEELITDIEQGYIFRVDTAFRKPTVPYVSQGNWSFYVHEENTVNLEVEFSDLLMKPKENIFPTSEQVIVEVISPDGQSVYHFEKMGEEITKDTSIQEQISVTQGEWTLRIGFAYVCGETPAHLKIAANYETPSEEDINWLKEERLNNKEGL
ncbi:MAG: hypothetical protein HDR19_02925 [Lachnospiraceae bacterium]|nr:hypothetical protein [Lachnospiraceae bacterium]